MAGDLNGDGNLDLALTHTGTNTVTVVLNDGKGLFSEPIDYAAGHEAKALVASDLNGDGRVDLATANASTGTVSVLFNTCL